ncbi:uncharacterized protein K444DRAFT_404671 [Hyaloscypha bicolor E]|uniref:Uncharacterized protein n=1 Tax=Hyaloscypha bicolor E TaxID=1095630 RepID=A0A2J6T9R2_9HELO|nr:uncharacterized protein K444DRAFT_404671 [Hyaloscypha bicolor E]PMD59766.1 hypothetical protein K444DRAFT_404671 [Hyaloscypha bicolor E]
MASPATTSTRRGSPCQYLPPQLTLTGQASIISTFILPIIPLVTGFSCLTKIIILCSQSKYNGFKGPIFPPIQIRAHNYQIWSLHHSPQYDKQRNGYLRSAQRINPLHGLPRNLHRRQPRVSRRYDDQYRNRDVTASCSLMQHDRERRRLSIILIASDLSNRK